MVEIGEFNKLKVVREREFGFYFDGEDLGDILLPRSDTDQRFNIDEEVNVFIYFDSEDKIIATTKTPKIQVGKFASLKVVSVTSFGAFLDWGLPKDLFVPFKEQRVKMEEGKNYLVRAYYDASSNRIAASSRLDKYLESENTDFIEEQKVDLLISGKTELGYKAIINGTHLGVIYGNEVFRNIEYGQKITGYIKKIRKDKKIDLSLEKPGPAKIDGISQLILDRLIENNGFLEITDKSSPELISSMFGVSKKSYKKAIGALYKRKHIILEENGIRLIDSRVNSK